MEDKKQLEAISIKSGPALVLAGPGSGKTHVLTHHIKYLIDHGVAPDNILVITFTRSAASEMRARFKTIMPHSANKVSFGTFHSLFYKLIKFFNQENYDIISSSDKLKILTDILEDSQLAEEYADKISQYKSVLNTEYKENIFDGVNKDKFIDVLEQYNYILSNSNKIDFDDIILMFYKMVFENLVIRKAIFEKYTHICIDEFQDINDIQYESIKLISKNDSHVFVVGDEDQSIYGFRGANSKIMRRFLEDYRPVKVIELTNNYRSNKDIIDLSYKLISHNFNRLKSDLSNCIKNSGHEKSAHIIFSNDKNDEYKSVICELTKVISEKKTCAVLFRTNKEVREFNSLIYSDDNRDRNMFKRELISDIEAYIKYCFFLDDTYLDAILNSFGNHIGKGTVKKGETLEACAKRLTANNRGQKVYVLNRHINFMKKLSPYSFLQYLKNVCGQLNYLKEKYYFIEGKEIEDYYESISNRSKTLDNYEELYSVLEECLKYVPKDNPVRYEKLIISTYHQSKGLEYDCVILPDIYEGNVPLSGAIEGCNVEEERRLLYVAMTRAKNELYIHTIKNEESGGKLPSRFIKEMIYWSSNSSSSRYSSNLS